MSKGQTPRTPRYFPRMKVRGKRRRAKTAQYGFERAMDAISRATQHSTQAFHAFAKMMSEADRITAAKEQHGDS